MYERVQQLLDAHDGTCTCGCLAQCIDVAIDGTGDSAAAEADAEAILDACLREHPAGTSFRRAAGIESPPPAH